MIKNKDKKKPQKGKKKELAACYFRTVYYRRRYDA